MDPFAHVFSLILCIASLFLFTGKTIVTRRFENTLKTTYHEKQTNKKKKPTKLGLLV